MANLAGRHLAQEVLDQSRGESRTSPMEETAAASGCGECVEYRPAPGALLHYDSVQNLKE
jgi:hypothetical protein